MFHSTYWPSMLWQNRYSSSTLFWTAAMFITAWSVPRAPVVRWPPSTGQYKSPNDCSPMVIFIVIAGNWIHLNSSIVQSNLYFSPEATDFTLFWKWIYFLCTEVYTGFRLYENIFLFIKQNTFSVRRYLYCFFGFASEMMIEQFFSSSLPLIKTLKQSKTLVCLTLFFINQRLDTYVLYTVCKTSVWLL